MTPAAPPPFRVLFISGPSGDTRRYRCFHPLEQLRQQGVTAGFREGSALRFPDDVVDYDIFILHR
jgi:hypothetical protein